MHRLSILLIVITFVSCQEKETPITAQYIVNQAIASSCNGNCSTASIDFTFRGRCYVSKRNHGSFQLERISSDSTGITHDILTNNKFQRYKNDTLIKVSDSMVTRYSNSLNSVHYFAQLPFGLNAPAVQKEIVGDAIIKGEPYFEIGVKFMEEGGGTDFQDEFVYWIHKEKYTVDYLAYSYATNGGGIRFREASYVRNVEGIRFVDYNNYQPQSLEVALRNLDALFEKGALKLLSKIETESVGVVLTQVN